MISERKRPSYAPQAILEVSLFTSKYRLQNWRCVFMICEPSQVLKSGLSYTPQISLLYVRIGEIIVWSNILQLWEPFLVCWDSCVVSSWGEHEELSPWDVHVTLKNFPKRTFEFLSKCTLVQHQLFDYLWERENQHFFSHVSEKP